MSNPPPRQSHKHSILEALVNTGAGFLLSWGMQHWVVPAVWPQLHYSAGQSLGITALFTAVSLVRSYAFRRLFNRL